MPISVSFHAPESLAQGFTLLELLIVLALLAMMTALVAPRMERTYPAIAGSGERDEVHRQIERLPRIARTDGRRILIAEGDVNALAARLDLPEGWIVTPLEAIRVEANGLCRGSTLRVQGRGNSEEVELRAPACGVARAP
jgi:prepilin-type N-terminal cleavage/methylation domain-containing protein